MKILLKLGVVLCVMQMSSVASAATLAWENGSGDQDWGNAANWTDGGVPAAAAPTSSDETHFTAAHPAAIVSTVGTPSARLVMDGGSALDIQAGASLGVSGQVLLVNGGTNADLNIDGTMLAGNIFGIGTAGTGTATVTVGPAGSLDVSNPGAWLLTAHGGGTTGNLIVNGGTVNSAGFMSAGWAGTGNITVNGGGSITVGNLMTVGPNPGATGNITINDGTITSIGLQNTSGSVTLEDGTSWLNTGGYAGGGDITINGSAEFIFTNSTRADIFGLLENNPLWHGSGTLGLIGGFGHVAVTNVPEPASLALLAFGVGLAVCRRQQRA